MGQDRTTSGEFAEKATLEDVLDAFDSFEGPPVATSGDIAEATGVSVDSARRKLNSLRDRGQVGKRETASRAALYWRIEDADD